MKRSRFVTLGSPGLWRGLKPSPGWSCWKNPSMHLAYITVEPNLLDVPWRGAPLPHLGASVWNLKQLSGCLWKWAEKDKLHRHLHTSCCLTLISLVMCNCLCSFSTKAEPCQALDIGDPEFSKHNLHHCESILLPLCFSCFHLSLFSNPDKKSHRGLDWCTETRGARRTTEKIPSFGNTMLGFLCRSNC